MSSPATPADAAATVAVLTIAHGRHGHLSTQVAGLGRGRRLPDLHVVVAMDDPDIAAGRVPLGDGRWQTVVDSVDVVGGELPLAAARNRAASVASGAGADVLVFLDVDCVPGPGTVEEYAAAVTAGGRPVPAVFVGDVAYLPPAPEGGYPLEGLAALGEHRPGRPVLPPGRTRPEPDLTAFWSLSFAMSVTDWHTAGGFCEDYVGYGGEDTDFGQVVGAAGGSLTWVGGATAYHQHHGGPTHWAAQREAIVRNANLFHDRWGWFPMQGWLERFAAEGLARLDPASGRWVLV